MPGTVPSDDWAFADCRTAPFPGTPDPSRICLRSGFDPSRLYELVYTAKDPLVLGIGFAATRDIVDFFRHAAADANGTANPVAGRITHSVALGASQSGNFLKTFVHLGFNEDASGRPVWDGILPYIAGRQLAMNVRFAAPGGAAGLYEPGSEPALWWGTYHGRGRAAAVQRACSNGAPKTRTCPKVIEAFGATEFWGLRMSPGLVGTDAATGHRAARRTSAATTCRERTTAAVVAGSSWRSRRTSAAACRKTRTRWPTHTGR